MALPEIVMRPLGPGGIKIMNKFFDNVKRAVEDQKANMVRVWMMPRSRQERPAWGVFNFVRAGRGFDIIIKTSDGEEENVDKRTTCPNSIPVKFGEEPERLVAGDFCEIQGDDEEAIDIAVIKTAYKLKEADADAPHKRKYLIVYPTGETKTVLHKQIRRAYIHVDGHWYTIQRNQEWDPVKTPIFDLKLKRFTAQASQASPQASQASTKASQASTSKALSKN